MAFLDISLIESCISSAAAATEETFFETCSLAAETTFACTAVSSALPAICWLTAVNSSDDEAVVAAFCPVIRSGSTMISRVLLIPSTIFRKSPGCFEASARNAILPLAADFDNISVSAASDYIC